MYKAPQIHVQILKLLPKGPLWDGIATFKLLFYPLAQGLEYIDHRMCVLLREARPKTAVETIEQWENEWGLPDTCHPNVTDLTGRQTALWQKIADNGGQTLSDYELIATRLGYQVALRVRKPFRAGARIGARVNTPAAIYTIDVNILAANETFVREYFRAGSRVGKRLKRQTRFVIECVFNRRKQSHKRFIFNYYMENPNA